MDSIAITKPNMGVLPQDRPGLSPFGVLSQAFSQEMLSRAGFQEGRGPFVALDLLEEGEEAPASPPPVQPVSQIDLRLVLQNICQLDMRTEKAVERIIRLREQGRPHPAPVQPTTREGGRKGTAGQTNQTAGPKDAGEGRAQSRVRGVPRQAAPGPGPGGGKHAIQTPEPVVSAAGSFARLQNFYNTINQHLQFIANIRGPGVWRPGGPTAPQRTPNGLDRRSTELFRRVYGLRQEQGRMSVPAAVFVGIPSLAGAAVSLAAGDPSGLPRSDTARRDAGPLTAGELAYLEDGMGSAVMNGAADAAAGSRRTRREAGQLERAIAAQALHPDAWTSMLFARGFHPDARKSMRSVRTFHPDVRQSMPSARMLRRDSWNAMPGLGLWRQGAGGKMSGHEKAAGWPPQSIPQRPWGVERPIPGSGKAVLAPPGSISTIETAAFAGRARWGKNLWSISRQSAVSGQPGIEGQAVPILPRDAPVPAPPMSGELAHRTGPEEERLPRQEALKAEPAERGVLGDRTVSVTVAQSAQILRGRAVPGPRGLTALKAGPMGADAAAQANQPAADSSILPSMSLEEARQSSLTMGTWPRTEKKEKPILPPFSEMPGKELVHRAALIGPEWDFGSDPLAGRTQISADRARTSTDKAQASEGRTYTSTSKVQTSAGRTQTSADRMQTSVGGAQISSDIPARLLETGDAAQHGQAPQADPVAVQSKPPVSALCDIRTVKVGQSTSEPGGTPPGTSQTGEPLSALFGLGTELIHSADSYRDSAPASAEAGTYASAALTAQAKGWRPQADSQKGKARRAKPAAQTGRRGTRSGAPWGQVQTEGAAGSIGQAEGIAALRYVPLAVNQMQGLLTGSLRDIGPFAAGRAGLTAGMKAPQEGQSAAPYHEILPPGEMIHSVQSKDTARAGVETRQEGQSAAPRHEILPPGEMTYGVQSKDTAGAGVEMPREGHSAAPYQEIVPPGEMIFGVQNQDTAGVGKNIRSRAVPAPLELTYGGAAQPSAAEASAPAAGGQKPVQGSMESDYVRNLPDWAKRFLQEGAPQTREEAVRRLGTGREQTMGTAQNIAVLPSFSEEAGSAFQWTAPDARAPAPMEYREPRRQQDPPQLRSVRISDAELQRTADRVYRIIEDRIRRERWRLGL